VRLGCFGCLVCYNPCSAVSSTFSGVHVSSVWLKLPVEFAWHQVVSYKKRANAYAGCIAAGAQFPNAYVLTCLPLNQKGRQMCVPNRLLQILSLVELGG
jgi:hypothetical protein